MEGQPEEASSKFFQVGNASDEEDNEIKSEDEEQEKIEQKRKQVQKKKAEDEEDEDNKKTKKEKRHAAFKEKVHKIMEKIKINDFVAILTEFDELNKLIDKAKRMIDKEGLPTYYLKICIALENIVTNMPTEEKKKLNERNSKSLNLLKQKVKKLIKLYTKQIDEYKNNPAEESEEEEEKEPEKKEKKEDEKKDITDDKKEESEESSESDEEVKSKDSDEDILPPKEMTDRFQRRQWWFKKEEDAKKEEKRKKEKEENQEKEDEKKKKVPKAKKEKDYSALNEQVANLEKKKYDITLENYQAKLREIVENRIKKQTNTNYREFYEMLLEMMNLNIAPKNRLELLLILIPTRHDVAKLISSSFLPKVYWLDTYKNLIEFLSLLKNPLINLTQLSTYNKEGLQYYNEKELYEMHITNLERLSHELSKNMKNIEHPSLEYGEIVVNLFEMIKLLTESLDFYESKRDNISAARIALILLENVYYLNNESLDKMKKSALELNKTIEKEYYAEANTKEIVHKLATFVYLYSDDKSKVKAILYQIYHHAIHNRYSIAKDYLLMSHVADSAQQYDIQIQILYNRVLVQLGIASFRLGLIQDTYNYLQELINTQKTRELLAQGLSKNPVTEKEERRRLLPYICHISIELIESVFLITAMLLEIPHLAGDNYYDINWKPINKNFRKLLEYYQRIPYLGPPETYKDYIYAASQQLVRGNWKRCYDYLMKLNMWNKVFDEKTTKVNLLLRVKEQGLKSYILSYKDFYESISLEYLSTYFELDSQIIHTNICKMIAAKEIVGWLNPQTNCLNFENIEKSYIEELSSELSEKIIGTVKVNETVLDKKFGHYGFADKDLIDTQIKKKTTKKKIGMHPKKKKIQKRYPK